MYLEIRGQFWGVSFPFHYVDPGDQTQVARLSGKGPLPIEPPPWPA